MKNFYIYKKWNFLILLNNLISTGFFIYSKKIIFLKYDMSKYFFLSLWKEKKISESKSVKFKKKV